LKADFEHADNIIPPSGMRLYYDAVTTLDPDVRRFYRLFESPGMGHCFGGSGPYSNTIFDSLVAWVETGMAPDNLTASFTDIGCKRNQRILCPYPERAHYDGTGDPTAIGSFYCSI
jgi:hypothetical protein